LKREGIGVRPLTEIGYEQRNGYRWYVDGTAKLMEREHPEWVARRR
jgi:hypothetical protein